MRRRYLLGATGAFFGAGCLRLDGGGEGDESNRVPAGGSTTSSAGSPGSQTTERATAAESADPPPGIGGDTVEPYLADAHVNALSQTSFTATFRGTDLTRGETQEARTAKVGDEGALEEWADGSGITLYYTADGSYWRQRVGGRTTYGHHRKYLNRSALAYGRELRQLVLAGTWAAPERAEDGRTFTIRADGVDETAALEEEYEAKTMKTFSAEGRVAASGVVREFQAEFQFVEEEADRLRKVQVDFRTTNVGKTDVSKPGWFDTAKSNAPQVTARIVDGEFIEMNHEGGTTILPDTNVVIYDRNGRGNWGYDKLQQSIEAGTTLYLWMENDELQWETDSKPTGVSPQPLDGRYGFWMYRRGAEYFGNIELPQ